MPLPELIADSPVPGDVAPLTTLSGNGGSISNSALSMKVATGVSGITAGLAYPGQAHVVVDGEEMIVSGPTMSGTTWTILQRGVNGAAASHNDGAQVYHYLSVGALLNLLAQDPALQNGVVLASDLAMTGISISGAGALSFTPAATSTMPSFVQATSGLLVPVGYAGGAQTLTPGTLPTSGNQMVIGVEIDTTGAIFLVSGASTATVLSTGVLIASHTPATTAGRMRVADIAIKNTSGTYALSNGGASSQGVNWIDRRPWCRGAGSQVVSTTTQSTTSNVQALIDATHLSIRMECTGVPVRVRLFVDELSTPAGGSNMTYWLDGAQQDNHLTPVSTTNVSFEGVTVNTAVAAGSHLFQAGWASLTNGQTTTFTGGAGVWISVEEITRQNANNGIA